ncbi:nitric oxide reductase activation protein NorD [Venatoribacter cucullus]|uniref:nitric oxide reductase activation protein NorD n=1 Tax=Venatoribacter cucullus TaxID=2661630 RepID=UPI00223FCE44|nr:VWA domain-containing protein [Venatoribacter cucullus]UZK03935.1 VWA domain-containing protein [Venatoribacter cucullus]
MEEAVGIRWHHFITRMAQRSYPQARVTLEQEQPRLAVVLRALGGDAGLSIRAAAEQRLNTSRSWLQKVAGNGLRFALAWRDADTLYLPAQLEFYPSAELNRELYLWLTALASCQPLLVLAGQEWHSLNQQNVKLCLQHYPGLEPLYHRLVVAEIQERDLRLSLKKSAWAREEAIRLALAAPGSVAELPAGPGDPDPVPLWLYDGRPPKAISRQPDNDSGDQHPAGRGAVTDSKVRRQADFADDPDGRDGLLIFRLESLFSWSEFIPVDRTSDDSDDPDAGRIAEDLDRITLSQNRSNQASRIRLDLDLPSAAEDDIPLGEGLPYPEWDYRKNTLRPDYCRVIPMLPRAAQPTPLPAELQQAAARLRRQFSAFSTAPLIQRRQLQGEQLDLAGCIDHRIQQLRGQGLSSAPVWKQQQHRHRDLSCLVLADLSLSTDAWANNEKQVIDVIRDSLHLMGEALDASDDDFALYGFSSRRRDHVRFNLIKNFNEAWDDVIHGRIQALEPGYYTRMGAAIRQAVDIINDHPAEKRLLLLLTDGKPNDLDIYEGRYGIEDTRMAIQEAHRAGVITYCVTIDQSTADYVPYVFGQQRYFRLNRADQLPQLLPRLYLNLTGRML